MWSGTTIHGLSGNFVGAHQKFDRVARKYVSELRTDAFFPNIKDILHFEGNNGPDGIKRKSPAQDEPWHYWDPTDETDIKLSKIIENHQQALVTALKNKDSEKAAFESAWLAHAIVDGLTPAHHYPYEDKLVELRGEGLETRNSIRSKAVIKGETKRQTVSKNWQFWGAKGLFVSHFTFEWGVASLAKPLNFKDSNLSSAQIKHAKNVGLMEYIKENALEIHSLNMYDRFLARGWSVKLSHDVRKKLCPIIIQTIAMAWILAIDGAESQ
jgi:hypothetical protein